MGSFYIFLSIAIATGAFIGWVAGFARLFLSVAQLLLALAVAYYANEAAAFALGSIVPVIAEWAAPVAFVAVAFCCFAMLRLLSRKLAKTAAAANQATINRYVGAAAGITVAFAGAFFFARQPAAFAMPQNPQVQAIATVLNEPIELANDKLPLIFQQHDVQVMASDAAGTVAESGIALPFKTGVFEIRSGLEKQMLQLVNAERIKHGLNPLVADNQLAAVARLHSADMLKRGYFSHNTPEGKTPFDRLRKVNIHYRYAGENLAMAPSLLRAHAGLMKSPGHRANILNRAYGRMGIGILDAGARGLMITQEFRD